MLFGPSEKCLLPVLNGGTRRVADQTFELLVRTDPIVILHGGLDEGTARLIGDWVLWGIRLDDADVIELTRVVEAEICLIDRARTSRLSTPPTQAAARIKKEKAFLFMDGFPVCG